MDPGLRVGSGPSWNPNKWTRTRAFPNISTSTLVQTPYCSCGVILCPFWFVWFQAVGVCHGKHRDTVATRSGRAWPASWHGPPRQVLMSHSLSPPFWSPFTVRIRLYLPWEP